MDLTLLEEKILKTLSTMTDNRRVSIYELAQKVGCAEDTILKRLQKPEFRGIFMETLKNTMVSEVPEILNAFMEQAKAGSFKHGKLIFEMVDFYHEKKETKIDIGVREGESIFKDETERKALLMETLGRLNTEEDKS